MNKINRVFNSKFAKKIVYDFTKKLNKYMKIIAKLKRMMHNF